MLGLNIDKHLTNLEPQVNSFVERQHEVAFGELNRLTDLNHRHALGPGKRRAVEGRIVTFGDEEAVVALLAENRMLEIFETPAEKNELIRKREVVRVPKV